MPDKPAGASSLSGEPGKSAGHSGLLPAYAVQLYAALFRIVRQSLSPYPVGLDAIFAARAALNAAEGAGIGKPGATAAVFKAFYKRQGQEKGQEKG